MIVMMENKSYSQVIGQTNQPYTTMLATTYGLATQSYAFGHPSLPNYLDIVSGSNQGVTNDGPPSSHKFPSAPTLADQLAAAGFSAKAYAENLPADPTNNLGEYAVRHVPWEYFPATKITVADASSMIGDLNGANAPDFVWYTPNLIDDEHDGSTQQGDAFLSKLIPEVQSTSWYRAGGRIIVEWDESDADNSGVNGSWRGPHSHHRGERPLRTSPKRDSIPGESRRASCARSRMPSDWRTSGRPEIRPTGTSTRSSERSPVPVPSQRAPRRRPAARARSPRSVSVVRELIVAWSPGEDRAPPWTPRGHVAEFRFARRRADGEPDGGSAMSVTVPSGAQGGARFAPKHDRPRAADTEPAVVYLAAARNTYGTLSYRRAMRRLADEWPRAVVMDADACGFVSRADWHLRWPFIRDGIDSLVVLAEEDGSISRETWLELRDAMDSGLSCWFVTGDGHLAFLASIQFQLYATGVRTERRWAHAEVQAVD